MSVHWTKDNSDELCALVVAGHSLKEIGLKLKITRGQASGAIHRLKLAKDARLFEVLTGTPAERKMAINRKRMDVLAEHLSNETSVSAAAKLMHIEETTAWRLFDRICKGLGRQAR